MTGRIPLPIDELLPGIIAGLRDQPNAVITAAPGAGKSTRVPVAIASHCSGQVLLLQPRRVAARAAAGRMAEEQGWKLGEEIGYQIRFENRTSAKSRIVVMTEGILSRRIQRDPFLEEIGCVIIDEFHERNLHTDLAVALLREIQQEVRPDLRIVVMSATLDTAPVCEFLNTAAVFTSEGRTFPLDISHGPRADQRPLEERMAEAIVINTGGPVEAGAPHVLAFLPGMAEIRRVSDRLPSELRSRVHVLHSSVSAADQEAALRPSSKQKIILATNIAETSLTIDGVGLVIDSGYARVPVHDTRLGFDRLETRRISKASATQRAGRAGRSGPGRCVRLFSAEEFGAMEDYESPEIQRLDLAGLILTLKAYGVSQVEKFRWFETPPKTSLDRAMRLLTMLGALDESGRLTKWGKSLATLPLHPRLGSVFVHGVRGGFGADTAWLCALLESGDLTAVGSRSGHHESDALDRLDEVISHRHEATWNVRSAARQLASLADKVEKHNSKNEPARYGSDRDAVLRQGLLRGYPDRVILRRAKGELRGVMVGGRGVRLASQSRVTASDLFVALDVRENDRTPTESTVYSASGVDFAWLQQLFPHLHRIEETVKSVEARLIGVRRERFVDLIARKCQIL